MERRERLSEARQVRGVGSVAYVDIVRQMDDALSNGG